ncbi:MAG: hypothetical protein QG656_599 [Candidatus Hydrogenedentes bacterium]|nr:hypothetical protein [Candidatus Hydrogenedentota bacterium]
MIVASGNGEAASMYAAYELLEWLRFEFQLTEDIAPETKPGSLTAGHVDFVRGGLVLEAA